MEMFERVISLVLSLIGAATAIYKLIIKSTHNREDEYYEKILRPYIVKYVRNKDINTVKCIKALLHRDDDFVPKYVFYLADREEKEKLKEVLIMDYIDLYNNDDNKIIRVSTYVQKIFYYVLSFIEVFLFGFGIGIAVISGISLLIAVVFEVVCSGIVAVKNIKWWWYISKILVGVTSIVAGIIMVKLNFGQSTDRYSIKEKEICKHIANKTKEYKKFGHKYVI